MKSRFVKQLDNDRIVDAIRKAEAKTTGEIRVNITEKKYLLRGNELDYAKKLFRKLRMQQTPDRNGVLIVIFPQRRTITVLGDSAIHEKVGTKFWEKTLARATECFKKEAFSEGLIAAIEIVGQTLQKYFPKASSDPNSLPDSVTRH